MSELKDTKTWLKIIITLPDGETFQTEKEIILDNLKNLIGDANLKITVGHTHSNKIYGNGGETFISVSATCNQDDNTATKTVLVLKDFIMSLIPTIHSETLALWKQNRDLNNDILGAK